MKAFVVSFLTTASTIIALLLGLAVLISVTGALMFFIILAFRANVFIGLGISFIFICWIALLITIWENV